jgi:hypothetical protein
MWAWGHPSAAIPRIGIGRQGNMEAHKTLICVMNLGIDG